MKVYFFVINYTRSSTYWIRHIKSTLFCKCQIPKDNIGLFQAELWFDDDACDFNICNAKMKCACVILLNYSEW